MGSFLSSQAAPKWSAERDMPDLTGKTVVVTGGNAGIGLELVAATARRGAKVFLAARSEARATAAIEQVYRESATGSLQAGQVVWLRLDLADLASVVAAAAALATQTDRLDVLFCNAGVIPDGFVTTQDGGFEMAMAVAHVGHFLLVQLLRPLLFLPTVRAGGDVRVVTLSSAGHFHVPAPPAIPAFTDPAVLAWPGTGSAASRGSLRARLLRYDLAKLANVLFAAELQRRWDEESPNTFIALTLHPGPTATATAAGLFPGWLWPAACWLLFAPPARGAHAALFAGTAAEVAAQPGLYKGAYLDARARVVPASALARDAAAQRDLWATTRAAVQGWADKTGVVVDMCL